MNKRTKQLPTTKKPKIPPQKKQVEDPLDPFYFTMSSVSGLSFIQSGHPIRQQIFGDLRMIVNSCSNEFPKKEIPTELDNFWKHLQTHLAMLLSTSETESVNRVQVLYQVVYVLLHVNVLRKGINSSVLPSSIKK